MMGRLKGDQDRLFYEFDLDSVVPCDHLVRKIAAVLDLSWLRSELEPFYSHTGRPSIAPELMMRMLIVGYVFAIRSERRLCEEVQVNMAYRWFCRLSIEDQIPDHSAFSRARHERFRDADLFRCVFERVVGQCMAAGLVGGEGFSIDASLIQADVKAAKRAPGDQPIQWPEPEKMSRAVGEYLEVLEQEHKDQEAKSGKKAKTPPMAISLTDPLAAWVGRPKRRSIFAYDANYLIDNKHAIIVDAEATRANRSEEQEVAKTMIERAVRRLEIRPKRLAGDTVYGAAPILKWLLDRGIEPHIPVWDKSKRSDGSFSRDDFSFDGDADLYRCPAGKMLKTTGRVHEGTTLYYRASTLDCAACPLKPRCCPKTPARRIPRDVNEAARDHARSLVDTEAYAQSRRERKKVEMLFAHLKRILKLDRLRLRGLSGAKDEILLAAIAQNLRKLVKCAGPAPPMAGAPCLT